MLKVFIRSYVHWILALLLIFLLLTVASSAHIVARHSRMSPTESDRLMHLSFAEDYSVYLSAITMGKAGQLLFRNPFSTIDNRQMPNYLYYTVAGWLTNPFQLSNVVVYYCLRAFSGLLLVGSVFFVSLSVFRQRRLAFLATLLILLTSVFPDVMYDLGNLGEFTNWWSNLGALGRFDGRPHYILAHAFLLLAIGCFIRYRRTKQAALGALSGFLAAGAVLNVPFAIIPFWLVVVGDFLSKILLSRSAEKLEYLKQQLPIIITVLLPSAILLLLFFVTSNLHPVWKSFAVWEYTFWRRDHYFLYNFYANLVPLLLLGLPAIYWSVRKKLVLFVIFSLWLLLPLIAFITADLFRFSLGRVVHWNVIVPVAFLAVESYRRLAERPVWKKVFLLLMAVYLIGSCLLIINESRQQWLSVMKEPLASRYYNPLAFTNFLLKMKPYMSNGVKILTGSEIGLLLIADYPVRVYAGEQTHGINWDLDVKNFKAFLYQQMSETDAKRFLQQQKIEYVLDENEYVWNVRRTPLTYSFLKVEFEFDKFRLYRVLSDKL